MDYQVTNYECKDWDRIISGLPGTHLLQTWEWGEIKSRYGWFPTQLIWKKDGHIVAAALILKRNLGIPLFSQLTNIFYIPKGPLLDWNNPILRRKVLLDIIDYTKHSGALFAKIDPDVVLGTGTSDSSENLQFSNGMPLVTELKLHGWRFSPEQIQYKNTVQIDLTPNEETLLANMKQKTRYNIRLATRKGVNVRLGTFDDLELLYQMYAETSLRDEFVIRNKDYYKSIWATFFRSGKDVSHVERNFELFQPIAEPLIAEVGGVPIAAVIIYRFAGKAWFLYGMSRSIHREKMPNYLLQWEAMRRAKAAGCYSYDMWGAPDLFDDSDPLWGVYQFKEGFGGNVVRHLGAWDLPGNPVYYNIYSHIIPRILAIMRISGRQSTKNSL